MSRNVVDSQVARYKHNTLSSFKEKRDYSTSSLMKLSKAELINIIHAGRHNICKLKNKNADLILEVNYLRRGKLLPIATSRVESRLHANDKRSSRSDENLVVLDSMIKKKIEGEV